MRPQRISFVVLAIISVVVGVGLFLLGLLKISTAPPLGRKVPSIIHPQLSKQPDLDRLRWEVDLFEPCRDVPQCRSYLDEALGQLAANGSLLAACAADPGSSYTQCRRRKAAEISASGVFTAAGLRERRCRQRREVLDYCRAHGLRIGLLVVYGRERFFPLLSTIIERNLRSSGGIFDHVTFYIGRAPGKAFELAEGLRDSHLPGIISLVDLRGDKDFWGKMWSSPPIDTVNVRMDDDTIYVQDGAFEELLWRQLLSPVRAATYSANLVGNYRLPFLHNELGLMTIRGRCCDDVFDGLDGLEGTEDFYAMRVQLSLFRLD